MKLHLKIAVVLGALALAAAPAMALAAPSPTGAEHGKGPKYEPGTPETPGPKDPLPEQAKAYGVYCRTRAASTSKASRELPSPAA